MKLNFDFKKKLSKITTKILTMTNSNQNHPVVQWQQELEQRKKKILTPLILFLVSFVAVGFSLHHPFRAVLFFLVGMGALIGLIITALKNQHSHVASIRNALFKETNINLTYFDKSIIEFGKKINNAYFFGKKSTRNYHSVFMGNIDGFPVVIGDVDVTLQTQVLNRIFKGPIGYVQTSQKLPLVIVLPEKAINSPDGIVKYLDYVSTQKSDFRRLHFNDTPEFEKHFLVWTTDENKAKELLSPDLRNYLFLKAKVYPFYLTVNEEYIYFAVNLSRYCFTINLTRKFTQKTFETMKDDLSFYYYTFRDIKNYILSNLQKTL